MARGALGRSDAARQNREEEFLQGSPLTHLAHDCETHKANFRDSHLAVAAKSGRKADFDCHLDRSE